MWENSHHHPSARSFSESPSPGSAEVKLQVPKGRVEGRSIRSEGGQLMATSSRDEMVAMVIKVSRWDKLDRGDFHELLSPDCEYINMPMPDLKCVGPDQAHDMLAAFGNGWRMTSLDVKNIVSEGNVVLIERSERFENANDGRTVDLLSMGAFEFKNGKIAQWRDYFDPANTKAFFE
jgi:limonene-1,2-epoxide hydrolase